MGVPKFFRYISERYPCLSELVKEYQIPEFDNLYLDMNGIIHMCSHPDDNNPHFRITEEKIFNDVFHYIEVLFRMIRPQKLFFMAIDGVAPRAKMNQQRGRRFRSAKDAEKQEIDAKKKGEILPEEARFDSNCITPGTVFMARLHEQLQYFIVRKTSDDPTWQKCKVILSGHETPGEGEHKIMDYIRYMRAQPGYDPNTRHCLYGLDADLIMLGLCTHEPHFSLLREEVKFGKKSTKRLNVPEEITFYLLHLSLMREYLELEFAPLKNRLQGFDYDMEKIIDDWVLMGFLVGNDFIPHLPNLHIANGALPVLYKAYIDILPTLDGYINEEGTLNLVRFEKFMKELANIDFDNFKETKEDLLYMEAKTGRKHNAHPNLSRKLEEWTPDGLDNINMESLEPEKPKDSGMLELINTTNDMFLDSEEEETECSEDEDFRNFKRGYYQNKLEYAKVTPEVMRDQAEGYVRAIQWNLNYYYNGCCSWSWYYPHHYAPYISDIKDFSNLKIEFDRGKPFLPYEQLLAVLPAASKNLLPTCYHHLMTDEESIIKKYYPENFETDLNGKKQEWEAVVLVPFIDENVLLEAMRSCNDKLTPEEKKRNSHGPMLIYTYTPENKGPYPAPEYFPAIPENHSEVEMLNFDDILIPREKLVKGAYPGVRTDVFYPGFPTMKHLKYSATLEDRKIKVFESPSRNPNMIISIINDSYTDDTIPLNLLGTCIWVGWPHLVEAKVVAISNKKQKYVSVNGSNSYNIEERTGNATKQFDQEVDGITQHYQRRMGIEVGQTKVVVHVQVMIGRRYVFTPNNGRMTLDKIFTKNMAHYPLQAIVSNIATYDSYHSTFRDVQDIFPIGSTCFTLTNPYYGSQGIIQNSTESLKNGRLKISISVYEEPDLSNINEEHSRVLKNYKPLYVAAGQIGMTNLLFSRLTGSIFVSARNGEGGLKGVNIGLDLKFNKKNKETPGYTKKIDNTWQYSDKAVELVKQYSERYPEVLEYLRQDEKVNEIAVESMFKDEWEEKLKELQTWLKSLPTCAVEKRTCGQSSLEDEEVAKIEKIVDELQKSSSIKKVTLQIKPGFLYKSEVQNGTLPPDPKAYTLVLDRIINVRSGYSVPLGLRGTVMSIHAPKEDSDRDTMYDIVFDKPFQDGMKLNCSEGRGYRLPKSAFINISYGQRLMVEKSGRPEEVIAKAESCRRNPANNTYYGSQGYPSSKQPQQQWFTQQNQPAYRPMQPPFHKENSAFAQFSSAAAQSRPYGPPQYKSSYQGFMESPNARQQNPSMSRNYSPQKQQNGAYRGVPKKNDFMPSFSGNQEGMESRSRNQQYSQKQAQPDVSPVKESQTLNRDLLKTIFKIGKEREEEAMRNPIYAVEELVNPQKKSPSSNQATSKQDTPNKFFEMFAEAAKAPANVQLLTYYQSNGLGLPRYQYFNEGDLICCQTKLPNGEIVIGKPAKTREEASENVASGVLDIFLKKRKTDSRQTKTSKDRSSTQSSSRTPSRQEEKSAYDKPETPSQHVRPSKTTVLNNSFVPLQAIKSSLNKTNKPHKKGQVANEGACQEGNTEKQETKESFSRNRQNSKGVNSNAQANGPQKRRTRIAANFDLLKSTTEPPPDC